MSSEQPPQTPYSTHGPSRFDQPRAGFDPETEARLAGDTFITRDPSNPHLEVIEGDLSAPATDPNAPDDGGFPNAA